MGTGIPQTKIKEVLEMSDSIKIEEHKEIVETENILTINMNVQQNLKYIAFKVNVKDKYGIRTNVFLHTVSFDHATMHKEDISLYNSMDMHVTTLFIKDYDKLEVNF